MYMGVNTLNGMQFIDRILLLFMPAKHQPDYLYLRHVPLTKVHLFTAIQVAILAALWIIKSTPASLIFPLMASLTFLVCDVKLKARRLCSEVLHCPVCLDIHLFYTASFYWSVKSFWLAELRSASP